MEANKDILDNLKKGQKPEVPKDFFENFYDELMAKIAEEESGLANFQKTTKPDVPAEFFSNFAQNITGLSEDKQQTSTEQPIEQAKPTRIINLKIVGVIATAAACLLVMFQIVRNNTNEPTDCCDEPVAETASITDEDLLAFLDEDDIIDYMVDEEIELTSDVDIDEISTTETSNTNTPENNEESSNSLDELDDEDILYFFEDDLDDINLEDLDL